MTYNNALSWGANFLNGDHDDTFTFDHHLSALIDGAYSRDGYDDCTIMQHVTVTTTIIYTVLVAGLSIDGYFRFTSPDDPTYYVLYSNNGELKMYVGDLPDPAWDSWDGRCLEMKYDIMPAIDAMLPHFTAETYTLTLC